MLATDESLREIPQGMYARLPSIVPSYVLTELWKTMADATELRSDVLSLAQAYVVDKNERAKSAELTLISMGIGTMSTKTVETTMPESRSERLLRQGHIKRVPGAGQMLIVPTVPELLSAGVVSAIKPLILEAGRSLGPNAATEQLLQHTIGLPLGDRVAALVLQALLAEDAELFSQIFQLLMSNEPKQHQMKPGRFLMQLPTGDLADMHYENNSLRIILENGTETVIPFDEDEDDRGVTGNLHPWNILSHLAYAPLGIAEDGKTVPLGPMIMERIGRFRSTLKSFGPSDFERSAVYEHNLPGFGRVPCPARGIVEPIVYAMQFAIQNFGPVMDYFIAFAIGDRDPALLMRVYVAASSLADCSDEETRARAVKMTRELSGALDAVFKVIHPPQSGDEQYAENGDEGYRH
jgi:hypothetical protein